MMYFFLIPVLAFGISMDDMVEEEWFWGRSQLVYAPQGDGVSGELFHHFGNPQPPQAHNFQLPVCTIPGGTTAWIR